MLFLANHWSYLVNSERVIIPWLYPFHRCWTADGPLLDGELDVLISVQKNPKEKENSKIQSSIVTPRCVEIEA